MIAATYTTDAIEHRDACARHADALQRYTAAPPRSPEADAAWREVQRASDAAQLAARRMRGAT